MILNAEQLKEFREASEPMLKFLKKMGSPYLSAIFKDNHAELVNGVASNNLPPLVNIEIPKQHDPLLIPQTCPKEDDEPYKDICITWKCKKCGHIVKRSFFSASTEKDITAFEDKLEYTSGCPGCLTIPARFMRIPE